MGNAALKATNHSKRRARQQFSNASSELRRTTLKEDDDDTAQEYFKVLDRVGRYIKQEHKVQLEILSIERIENPVLDRRLRDVASEMHVMNCPPELLFHGTRSRFVEGMIKNGFSFRRKGLFGQGFYFYTDSTKAAKGCGHDTVKCLLLCDVQLGKTMAVESADRDLSLERIESAGFDSVYGKRDSKSAGGVFNDEYVVFRSEQVAPRYLVKFICQ